VAAVGRSFFGRFFGNTIGEAAAFAMGTVTGPALGPLVQDIVNEARAAHRVYPIGILDAAQLVAEGLYDEAHGDEVAAAHGIGAAPFADLVRLAEVAPGVPLALTLWRRGAITEAQVEHALEKAKIEPQYREPLKSLFTERLDPSVVALAIVRGIMDDPGYLPVGPPSGSGKVEPFPRSKLDTLKELAASGFDRERGFVQTAISGRPMGPESAASAVFREIIEKVDYQRAISEGDVRNEWAEAIFETARQIATVSTYVEAHLKGWISEAEMNAGAARHGMSAADTHLMFLAAGRPAAPQQMATAIARGVDGPDGKPMDKAQFVKGIQESNIRPEWAEMLYGIRHAYPPLFQINRLVQAHAITPAVAVEWAIKDRYAPEVVTALQAYWGAGTVAAAKELTKSELLTEYDGLYITEAELLTALQALGLSPEAAQMEAHLVDARRVKAARDKVVKAVHDQYVGHAIQRAEAEAYLVDDGFPAEAIGKLLTEWDHELAVSRKSLTPTQIVRAYRRSVLDRATALQELQDAGYTAEAAGVLLDTGTAAPPQAPLP
jgi:hypothetical protein